MDGVQVNKTDCFAMSDVGRERREIQDPFLVADLVRAARIQQTSLTNHSLA